MLVHQTGKTGVVTCYECVRDPKGSVSFCDLYMAIVKRCCSWRKTSSDGERGPKSVNILLGCFFLINYNLGDSYLAYPYAFYHAGYLAAIPTLLHGYVHEHSSSHMGGRGHGKGTGGFSISRTTLVDQCCVQLNMHHAFTNHAELCQLNAFLRIMQLHVIAFECPNKESVRHAGSRVL